ncbi:ShlB/FhaC/HecB family hemolysin secretion/activation protein [Salmonella enterica]|nr:ShlB/FhaC/HecB family hemolysin secretion/activation protein [Salmonella enterica]
MLRKLVPLALLTSSTVWAVPNAGSLGNQLRQTEQATPEKITTPSLVLPPETPSMPHAYPSASHTQVMLKAVHFTGNIVVPGIPDITEARLQRIVHPWIGRSLQFSDIQAMTDAVTQFYRQQGVLLARALIPAQTVKKGVLTVRILEGRYDNADIHNATTLREAVVGRLVSSTTPQGTIVKKDRLERVALLLNEIPGVKAQVALKSGQKEGSSALDIHLEPAQRFGAYVGLDNQGDPTTGRSRVMVGGYANNLLGLGDQLRVDILDAYEKSDLFNGALDYSLLAGGRYGTRVGANYSHLNYRYSLNKQHLNGYSDNWGLYVTQPWIRTSRARVDVRVDAGQQLLTDKYPSAFFQNISPIGRKQVSLGTLSVTGSVADLPGGLTGFAMSGTTGNVDLRSGVSRDLGEAADTGGEFARFNYQLDHDQQVWGPFSLYGEVSGQQANHNLDPSQKLLLGGPSAVRAYDIGDGSVDEGVVGKAEVRSLWSLPIQRWLGHEPQLTVAAFYDQGWGTQYRNNQDERGHALASGQNHNHLNLSGAGLYATVADAGNYAMTLTWAHRTGEADPNAVHDDADRIWISAIKTF